MSQGLTQAPSCGMCCYVPRRRTPSDTAPLALCTHSLPLRPCVLERPGDSQRPLGVASHPSPSRVKRKGRTSSPGNLRTWCRGSGPPGLFPGLSWTGAHLLCLCSPPGLWLFLPALWCLQARTALAFLILIHPLLQLLVVLHSQLEGRTLVMLHRLLEVSLQNQKRVS